jgi:hypothetical protein
MKSAGPAWWQLMAFAAAVRAAVLIYGHIANTDLPPNWYTPQSPSAQCDSGIEIWYRWDALGYLDICHNGYSFQPLPAYSNAAFMPLLPMIMRAGLAVGIDPQVSGLIAQYAAFIIGLAFFGKYVARLGFDTATVWRAVALLSAWPTAFFFGCPYQESLGFCGVAIALWALESKRAAIGTLGLAFASFARLTTVCIPAALFGEWIIQRLRGQPRRSLWLILAYSFAVGICIIIFFTYMQIMLGDFMAHPKAHEAWNRKPPAIPNIARTFLYLFHYYPQQGLWYQTVPETIALVTFAGLGLRALIVRGTFHGLVILLPILQALLTGTPMSLERIVLAGFPAFIDLAVMLRRKWGFIGVMILFIALQMIVLNGYIHFQFVG